MKNIVIFSTEFEKILKSLKKKKPQIFKQVEKKIIKIIRNPVVGKPLRNVLRNYRGIHINPFVLLSELKDNEIRHLNFNHHDKIYKKYSK